MDPLKTYRIPFIGLKVGIHDFNFELDKQFFSCFEQSELDGAYIKVDVILDKQSSMMNLTFNLKGTMEAPCDRCGSEVEIEFESEFALIVKYGEETGSTDEEILILGPSEHYLELSQYLYEYAHLSIPVKKTHQNIEDCDDGILDILDDLTDQDEEDIDPRWEALKKLK